MFPMGKLGGFISKGVYTISGPFHPFGGAVDIIVVEQPDGSFKSSPWHVRFGKFQGVLKASERIVGINVNGVDANFNMYLDNRGEAFFLHDVDADEGESNSKAYPSFENDVDSKQGESKSLEGSNGKIKPGIGSPRARIFGLSFGRKSVKKSGFHEGESGVEIDRTSSLERAQIAADLLEVRWTTNLKTISNGNIDSLEVISTNLPVDGVVNDFKIEDVSSVEDSQFNSLDEGMVDYSSMPHQGTVSSDASSCQSSCNILDNNERAIGLEKSYMRFENGAGENGDSAQNNLSEFTKSNVRVSCALDTDNNGLVPFGEEQSVICTECVSQDSLTFVEDEGEVKDHLSDRWSEPVPSIHPSGVDKESSSANGGCNGDEKLLSDVCKMEVNEEMASDEVLKLENSTIVDSSNCESCSNNELRSENLCSYTRDIDSHPQVSDQKYIVHLESQSFCFSSENLLGCSIYEKNPNAAISESSDEQPTCISILDDLKDDKVVGIEVLSPDGVNESIPLDSEESIEDELIETFMKDDKSNELPDSHLNNHSSPEEKSISETGPVSISEDHINGDMEFLTPVVESLLTMPLADDNVIPYDILEQQSCSLNPNLEALKLVNNGVQDFVESVEDQHVEHVKLANNSSQISEEIKQHISDPAVEVSLCRHLLYEGMGYEPAALAFDAEKLDKDKFLSLCPDIVKDDKLVVRIGGLYFPWVAALPIAAAIGSPEEQILEPKGMIVVGQANKVSNEVSTKPTYSKNGSWRNFPFSFKRSNTVRDKIFESDMALDNPLHMGRHADDSGTTGKKKKIWAKSPSSEQLASLKLKEGKNLVIFTFSTAMLGNQQIDARIFLWKWNTKIVISDVDGTITKSDVLGQFMPLMGIDWSHTGVAHLFSAVKENGYHFLFLSARSISQACQTRQFLVNLKQDGKTLPDGPIVISPDGLFPSLYREVIRRAPHEFKISCLEEIKALFPRDHTPFYAGFGNRHTDELSYLKVGIPKGKIFTINPKGEVVVNRTVDTKSYVSLHTLVHNMFPPTTRTEQEDYNSWNFWRLPSPDVSI